jgi:GT2 family glycosyltransferase
MKSKLVYILILNWNGWQDTIECVESCKKLTYPHFRILLVDNGSTDGSENILRERFPGMDFIQTGKNLGFAGGNNVGIQYALDNRADYIWLLNNDTVVAPDSLTYLVDAMEQSIRTGIVGSKIYYYKEQDKIWFAGGLWRNEKVYSRHRGNDETDGGQFDEIIPSDFISGCSLLIRSEIVRDIGFMDESYFLYWEDVDWNVRVAAVGWNILFVPQSRVWHKVSSSVTNRSYLQGYYYFRSALDFFWKHCRKRFLKVLLYSLYGCSVACFNREFCFGFGGLHGIYGFLLGQSGKKG